MSAGALEMELLVAPWLPRSVSFVKTVFFLPGLEKEKLTGHAQFVGSVVML